MNKKTICILLAVLLSLALLVTGCGSAGSSAAPAESAPAAEAGSEAASEAGGEATVSDGDTFKIGHIGSITGAAAFQAQDIINALEMGIEQHPEVLGKKVELVLGDASDAAQAVTEFERLYNEGCRFFIGGVGSHLEYAVQPMLEERECIFLACSAWADELTEGGYENYFQFVPRVKNFGERLADYVPEYAEKYLGVSKDELRVAVVWNNTSFDYVAQSALNGLKGAGINVVLEEGYPSDRKDFTALISKLESSDIHVLVPCQLAVDGAPFRKRMKEMGYEPPIFMAMGSFYDEADFAELGTDLTNGVMALAYTFPGINPDATGGQSEEFREAYVAKFDWEPTVQTLQNYAGVQFLLGAIDDAGTDNCDEMRQYLRDVVVEEGVNANYWGVDFDEFGRNTSAGSVLVLGQWQNGRMLAVGPDELKVSEAVVPWSDEEWEALNG